ncbi:hypothetical protein V9T40_006937 [Parthenolecanium corni]|uniref:Uncharacterized protein n=1 Tax=Parthenolecanium corni TaxID=536013 RepID=A0AAN9TTM4_9HEMI
MAGRGRARGRVRAQSPPADQPGSATLPRPSASSSSVPAVGRSAARGGASAAEAVTHQLQRVSLQASLDDCVDCENRISPRNGEQKRVYVREDGPTIDDIL